MDRLRIGDIAALLGAVEPPVERGEGLFQRLERAGRLRLGRFQPLGQLRHHLVNRALRRAFRIAHLDLGQAVRQADHVLAHVAQSVTGTDIAFVKLVRELAERAFNGADGIRHLRRHGLFFQTIKPFAFFAYMAGQPLSSRSAGH